MACPQKENGYTPIANELLEKIYNAGLNGTELAIILMILRKTYGYHKKTDIISITQFEKSIPVTRPSICKAIKNLQLVKIIKLVKKTILGNIWLFNKNYDEWQVVKKTKLVKKTKSASKDFDTKVVKKTLHTKDILTKDNIQKKHIGENTRKSVEANEILSFFKQTYSIKGNVPKQMENWRAAKWLFTNYGVEKTKLAIIASKQALEDQVAGRATKVPLIKNLLDLKEKYDQLRAYYGRRKQTSNTSTFINN